ncbi:MAG: cyclic nucleotide-binding domain-containing protein [Muribaculaceae bacterium]|nr:cyclic nucleotide-binding domain-containing protein [Muribaculaceae bacterium]
MSEYTQNSMGLHGDLSFYEKLMSLPLFHGVTSDAITDFAEHTALEFRKYSKGDIIVRSGEVCREVICLISGSITTRRILHTLDLAIHEFIDAGHIISADRLHGRNPVYQYDVIANSDVGIMIFSKRELMRLLQSNDIALMNWLNMISASAHRSSAALAGAKYNSCSELLWSLLEGFTEPAAKTIEIQLNQMEDSPKLGPDDIEFLKPLVKSGMVKIENNKTIRIYDRALGLKLLANS